MLKPLLKILKYTLLILIGGPILYFLLAITLSYIPINGPKPEAVVDTIYVHSNGVHLDISLPKKALSTSLIEGLPIAHNAAYLSFGWGDENFYLNTPNWSDLKASTALNAMFFQSTTLLHLTPYQSLRNSWLPIPVDSLQLAQINTYLNEAFALSKANQKQQIIGASYGYGDQFYRAIGSYSCLRTCNSWVNTGLKKSGLKACLWTPFDFPVLSLYR